MKEVNNIDAPEGAHDDKEKTIVDIIFEDFSTKPLNRPVVSPESKLRNLDRSPLFILREKPTRKASDRGSDDIEKEDTYNVNQTLVPSNQFKTEISNNYDWDEDDDDIFASISTQEILHHDLKIINYFPHTSKFLVNKEITQGNQRDNISGYSKSLVLRETNVVLGLQKGSVERPELGVGKNAVETSTPGVNRKFSVQEMEKDNDAVLMANRPKRWRLSGLSRTRNN
ncbi:hypothetical protein GQX74_014634 [Glossina fuscipes]|nr:hypothetical protein GQX74_014634 [Glossina fuscipes]